RCDQERDDRNTQCEPLHYHLVFYISLEFYIRLYRLLDPWGGRSCRLPRSSKQAPAALADGKTVRPTSLLDSRYQQSLFSKDYSARTYNETYGWTNILARCDAVSCDIWTRAGGASLLANDR